jgi:putative alpha-1,2-mannosidase
MDGREEESVPGYYAVLLRDYGVRAELTATSRVGVHKYRFPQDKSSHFIVDLDHGYDDGPGVVRWAPGLRQTDKTLFAVRCKSLDR